MYSEVSRKLEVQSDVSSGGYIPQRETKRHFFLKFVDDITGFVWCFCLLSAPLHITLLPPVFRVLPLSQEICGIEPNDNPQFL